MQNPFITISTIFALEERVLKRYLYQNIYVTSNINDAL